VTVKLFNLLYLLLLLLLFVSFATGYIHSGEIEIIYIIYNGVPIDVVAPAGTLIL